MRSCSFRCSHLSRHYAVNTFTCKQANLATGPRVKLLDFTRSLSVRLDLHSSPARVGRGRENHPLVDHVRSRLHPRIFERPSSWQQLQVTAWCDCVENDEGRLCQGHSSQLVGDLERPEIEDARAAWN